MVKKIFRNTLLTSLAAMICSVFVIIYIVYGYFQEQMTDSLKAEGILLSNGIKYAGEQYFEDFTPSDGCRITWIDKDGSVIYDSAVDPENMDNHSDREEIINAVKVGEGEAVRYSDTLSERTMYYAKLLEDGTVVRISYGYDTVIAMLVSLIKPAAIMMVVLAVIMYMVSGHTAKVIVSPINKIDLEKGRIEGAKEYEELEPLLSRIRRQNLQIDTKVMELKRENKRREDFRREFTANVSHELKTPLTSISGISEMMINGIIKQEDIPGFARNINKEAGRLISLVNDIILISELEGNEHYMQKEKVNMVELAASVIKRLEIPAGKRNVTMSLEAETVNGVKYAENEHMPEISVFGVYNMLEELIYNLTDNAIKYNVENGEVRISVKQCEKKVRIVVEDTGIGIPDEDKISVFERFYRVDKGRSKEVGGTGLGLSIVKHVAIYHGGSVFAENGEEGGTRMIAEICQ